MDLQIDDFHKDAAASLPRPARAGCSGSSGGACSVGRTRPSPRGRSGLPRTARSCAGRPDAAAAGYLRFDSTIRYEALDQAVLSEKGFLRLSRTVAGATPADPALPAGVRRVRATLAWQLREALAEGDGERLVRLGRLIFDNSSTARPET
ncbi:hypothetical protein [Azotobacter beijerinckii]|uniref:hypothetical protein n=1 Tax=Azotobacter beijerinckii TaxID=170623 RepID=UPI002955255F|nr:hypothetical protein [Azotobacter beijerinckii]MDV7212421.1 hypothetical protein [Azotobacter beijerinckii]